MAGEGTQAPANPWAQYGLNADGTPAEKPADKAPDAAAELADLKTKLATAEAAIAKYGDDFKGVSKQIEVVERLRKAFIGGDADPADPKTLEVWQDLMDVAKKASPGVYRNLKRLEDPQLFDKLSGSVDALAGSRLNEMNVRAHERAMEKAAKVFKGYTPAELEEAVLPYEETITRWINQDPTLGRRYVTGDLKVVDELFDKCHKPHISARLREKQARTAPSTTPKAPPRGGGAPGGDAGDDKPKARDFSPAGKQAFLKGAVSRWMDKSRNKDDE